MRYARDPDEQDTDPWYGDDDDRENTRLRSLERGLFEGVFQAMPFRAPDSFETPTSGPPPPRRQSGIEPALVARFVALPDLDSEALLREHPTEVRSLARFASSYWQGDLGPAVAALLFAPFWQPPPRLLGRSYDQLQALVRGSGGPQGGSGVHAPP